MTTYTYDHSTEQWMHLRLKTCPNCRSTIGAYDEFYLPCVCGDGCHDDRGFWCVTCVDTLTACWPGPPAPVVSDEL